MFHSYIQLPEGSRGYHLINKRISNYIFTGLMLPHISWLPSSSIHTCYDTLNIVIELFSWWSDLPCNLGDFPMNHGNFSTFQLIMTFLYISWIVSPWIYHHLPHQILDYDAIYQDYQVPIPEFTIIYQVPIKDIPHRIGFQDFYHLDLAVKDDETMWDMMDIWWL